MVPLEGLEVGYGFLFAFHSNMALSFIIFNIKRDVGRKITILFTHTLHSTPPLWGPRRNITLMCGAEIEWCGDPVVKKFDDTFSRFGTIIIITMKSYTQYNITVKKEEN